MVSGRSANAGVLPRPVVAASASGAPCAAVVPAVLLVDVLALSGVLKDQVPQRLGLNRCCSEGECSERKKEELCHELNVFSLFSSILAEPTAIGFAFVSVRTINSLAINEVVVVCFIRLDEADLDGTVSIGASDVKFVFHSWFPLLDLLL